MAEELSAAKVRRSLLRTVFLPVALWTWAKGSPRAEPIPIVRLRDARFAFDFSGEPRDGTLYVVHPYNPARYVPIAKVAEVVERERLNAYTQILADAGAKSIQVVSASVVETSASAGAEAPIEQSGAQLGLEFKRSASGEVERATRREYAALGGRMVRTPDQWPTLLEDESELRSVLHQRMNNGLVKAMVSLTTKNSEELSPELRGQVDKLKLSLGGDFKAASSVKWTFEVQFWPLPK